MKKAILFPFDKEVVLLSNFINCQEYIICGVVVLENSNISVNDKINIPILDIDNVDFDTFDSIILLDKEYKGHPFIESNIKKGKSIVYAEKMEENDISQVDLISEEHKITVPVVFVAGTTLYTEKFHVQLALRKRLIDDGYKVSQIGSKSYSNLFGFHSYPLFMNENIDNTQKIVLFRKYVKYIEMQEQPELIIIGIPGGIMAVNRKHHFDFGMTAYMISQAVEPDYVIMNMLYSKDYTVEQLEEIRQVYRFRLNFEIDSFHISNALLDPATLKSERLKFIKMGKKQYNDKVKDLYDFLDCADMDKAYETMLKKLSSYNVNQIF